MFPFFFPSQISLKIEISRYLSPDGGRGGENEGFFLGGSHGFQEKRTECEGGLRKIDLQSDANERRSQKYYRALWDLQPKTCDPPPPPRQKVITGSSPLVLIYLIWRYQETLISLIFSQATEN